MIRLLRRITAVLTLLPILALAVSAQVVMSDDFEANSVGSFPTGWTVVTGSTSLAQVTDFPVLFGVRALRVASGVGQTATIKFTTAISNDYEYDYYILIPDSGVVNQTKGSVKVENVGMQFGMGSTLGEGTIFYSNPADGWVVASNTWHHVKVEVDYQKNVARVTLNDTTTKKYMVSVSTSYDVRVESGSMSTILESHSLFVDSITVQTGTFDFPPAPVILSNPADLSINQNSPIYFSWSSITGSLGYHIQISTDSTFATGVAVNDTTLTSTTVYQSFPPLSPSTNYFWRVRSKNSVGWGDWSNVWRFRTVDPPGPPVHYGPADFADFNNTNDVYVYWSSPPFAVGTYHLQISEDSVFTMLVVNDSAVSSTSLYVSHPPLEVNKTYYWRVRALGAAGWGMFSMFTRFNTLQPPPPPNLSQPANGTLSYEETQIYFTWGFVSSAAAYQIEVAEDSLFTMIVMTDSGSSDTYTYGYFPPLEYNKIYYWRVRSTNSAGAGMYSPFRMFMTFPAPHAIFSGPVDGSTQTGAVVTLSGYVNYPESADSFRVQIAKDTNFTMILVDTVVTSGSVSASMGLFTPDSTYYWRIQAKNIAGWGPYPGRRSFVIGSLPAPPNPVAPTDDLVNTANPVYVDWTSVSGVIQYHVQVAKDSAFTMLVLDSMVTISAVNVGFPPLQLDTKYYWRVRVRVNVGWSAYSVIWRFWTPPPPSAPMILTPAPGTTDLLGNVLLTWSSATGKDTTFIEVTTDTSSVPGRVLGSKMKTIGSAYFELFFVRYYTDFWLNVTNLIGLNVEFFIRLQDQTSAGRSPRSPWYRFHTQRPPAAPTGFYPADGAMNVNFYQSVFSVDRNPVANTQYNITVQQTGVIPLPPPILNNSPMNSGTSYLPSGEPYNHFYKIVSELETNATYNYQVTAFNPAGSVMSPLISFWTSNPDPILHCTGDVLFDQGGFVNLELIRSGNDYGECSGSSGYCINEYHVWRLFLPSELPAWDLRKIQEAYDQKVPEKVKANLAGKDTIYIWEPLFFFRAIGRPNYLLTARTLRDSATGRPYVERYIVTAHSGSGRYWCSNIVTGYSVDNLAPEPPAGGSAVPDNGGIKVVWTPNDEKDLKDYTVYRSLIPNDDISSLTPLGSTTEPQFRDPDPPQVPTAYYYVVANDVNGNSGTPAIIEATIITGVEEFGGIPTEYSLGQNYPNPFNPATTIQFGLPNESRVELQVINTLGQVVETIVNDTRGAGYHKVSWRANVPSGIYIYRIIATPADGTEGKFTSIRKMLMLK